MAHPNPIVPRAVAKPNRRSDASQESIRSALGKLSERLASLERDLHDGQALVRQLAGQLDAQVTEPVSAPKSADSLERTAPAIPLQPRSPGESDSCSAGIRIYCFGSFEVYRGQRPIPLRRVGKASAILKLLALRPRRPIPRDVLMESVWPQIEPSVANNRLKVSMHHLRQVFASKNCTAGCPGCVLFRDGCYLLNPEIEIWTDVEAFEKSWQTGVKQERLSGLAEAITSYLQAESLYRNDLLEEDLFEEWTLLRREELKDTYLTLLEKLSRYWLQIGNQEAAIEEWKKILARDPWREDIYRRLMAYSARRGQRGLALRWYEICSQALEKQLKLGPEPETVALYHCILAGKDVSEWIVQ